MSPAGHGCDDAGVGRGGTRSGETARTITWRRVALVHLAEAVVVTAFVRRWSDAHGRRERSLRARAQMSDAERRRIASDLHDGAVQDVAGAAYAVAALARREDVPGDARDVLVDAAYRLRQGVRSLRSVLVEIHPPNVQDEGLATAIGDLLTRVHGRGVETTVESRVAPGVSPAPCHAELLYRVVLETVRHVLTEPRVRALGVDLAVDADRWQLRLEDRVDPAGAPPPASAPGTSRVAARRVRLAAVARAIEAEGGRVVVADGGSDGVIVRAWLPRPVTAPAAAAAGRVATSGG